MYINFLKICGLSLLIGSFHMAITLNVKNGCRDLIYIVLKIRMEDKPLWNKF
jgi:hypothetical protein